MGAVISVEPPSEVGPIFGKAEQQGHGGFIVFDLLSCPSLFLCSSETSLLTLPDTRFFWRQDGPPALGPLST